MNNMEELLKEEKKHIDALESPPELEMRLRNALDKVENNSSSFPFGWKLAAIAMLLFMFVGYNFNAFAYYGKKIAGFDEITSGTLKKLNEAGMGQRIEKKVALENGTELTLNGMMADENRVIIYYTLSNQNGLNDNYSDYFSPTRLTGFLTKSSRYEAGQGIINEDKTEFKGLAEFDSISPFSKKLTFYYWQYEKNGQAKEEKISFSYDPNKAMKTELKQSIKQKVAVDQGTITFDSIVASPTSTVIKGSLNVKNFDRLNEDLMGIQLIANGKSIEIIGSSSRSSLKGKNFEIQFDALPKKVQTLEVNVKQFVGYKKINETFPLKAGQEKAYKIDGKNLWFNNITNTSKGTEITVATDESIVMDKVSIHTQEGEVPLKATLNTRYVKQKDGKIGKERTLLFDTDKEADILTIGGMHYKKQYNKKIGISLD
ncbi:MAG: DUF4179 domain-containing protein [Bacillus sp. (in: firmicutes)]